jgi:adenosine deaminase
VVATRAILWQQDLQDTNIQKNVMRCCESPRVYIERCPISNFYLVTQDIDHIYAAAPSTWKIVLGTDDPLDFGLITNYRGIRFEPPLRETNVFQRLLEYCTHKQGLSMQQTDLKQFFQNATQAIFCSNETRYRFLGLPSL